MNRLASEAQPKTLEAEILDSVVDRWLVEGGDVLRTAHGHEHDVRVTMAGSTGLPGIGQS